MKYIKDNIVYDEYRGIPNADGKLVLGMTRAEILSLGYTPFLGNDLNDDGRTNDFCLRPYYIDFYSLYGETEALTQDVVLNTDLDDAITAYEDGRELVIRYWGELPEGSTDLKSVQESGEAKINAVYYFSSVEPGNLIFRSSFPVSMIDTARYTKSNYNCIALSTTTTPKVLHFLPSSDSYVSQVQVEELTEEEYVDLTKNAQGNFIVNSGSSSPEKAEYVRYVESAAPSIVRRFKKVSDRSTTSSVSQVSGTGTGQYVFMEMTDTEDKDNQVNLLICNINGSTVLGGEWELRENIVDTSKMIEVTYDELKTLRSESNLKPGTWYRLTDYQCTVFTENKRSLNHRFDIVILALSKNTLSEECRAIAHEEIYNVVFNSGSNKTVKCYVYQYDDNNYSIVNCTDLKGLTISSSNISIDESNRLVTFVGVNKSVSDLNNNNYPTNYFHSGWNGIDGLPSYCNVKSWKIWYTLDNINGSNNLNQEYSILNVTATVMGETATINTHRQVGGRFPNGYTDSDTGTTYYPWIIGDDNSSVDFWTTTTDISTGSYTIYMGSAPSSEYAVPADVILNSTMIIPKGRGTIYRMVDNNGNDCPYDFKNIQFSVDLDGTPTWVYTFTANVVTLGIIDGSLTTYGPSDPQNFYIQVWPSKNNIVKNSSGPIVMFHSDGGQYTEEGSVIHSYSGNNGNFIGEGCNDIILYGGWGNKFESYCREIKLGKNSSDNRFESDCNNIELAEYSSDNTFAQNCNNIKFLKNWTQYITVESNVSYVNLTSSGTTAGNNKLQYITISKGLKGSSGNPRIITHTTLNDTFKTIYQDESFILKGEVNSVPKEINLLTLDSFVPSHVREITQQNITDWNNKQETLVSGSSIKTVNGTSLLGSGDLAVVSVNAGDINVLQSTGDSQVNVMSQKAVTEYGRKATAEDLNGTSDLMKTKLTDLGWGFDKYVNSNGTIVSGDGFCASHFIPISGIKGHNMTFGFMFVGNGTACWAFYNNNKTFVSGLWYSTNSYTDTRTVDISTSSSWDEVEYVRITCNPNKLQNCYIKDNTTGEYLFKGDDYINNIASQWLIDYGTFCNTILTSEQGNNENLAMSQLGVSSAIEEAPLRKMKYNNYAVFHGATIVRTADTYKLDELKMITNLWVCDTWGSGYSTYHSNIYVLGIANARTPSKDYLGFYNDTYNLGLRMKKDGITVLDYSVGNNYMNNNKIMRLFARLDLYGKTFAVYGRKGDGTIVTILDNYDISSLDFSNLQNVKILTSVGTSHDSRTLFNYVRINDFTLDPTTELNTTVYFGEYSTKKSTTLVTKPETPSTYMLTNEGELSGINITTNDPLHKVIEVNRDSVGLVYNWGFYAFGKSPVTSNAYEICKLSFTDIVSPLLIKVNSENGGSNYIIDASTYEVYKIPTGANIEPLELNIVEGKVYYMIYALGSGYSTRYGHRIGGQFTMEITEPTIYCYGAMNLCAELYDGQYFCGRIPFKSDREINPETKGQFTTTNNPSLTGRFRLSSGNVQVYNGSTWKQINNS